MENSIENIWREGFLQKDALIAPQLNDLYNQKSQHIVDRFKRMFAMNLYGIMIGAAVLFIAAVFAGVPILGFLLSVQLLVLVVIGRKQTNALETIDKGESSYQYLKSFDNWVKKVMSVFGRLYRFMYPLLLITFILGFWFADLNEPVRIQLQADPDIQMIWGMPIWGLMGVGIIAVLFSLFSGIIYKWDKEIVYGRVMAKLEELIADMEELRA